jgi:hypothetical protein
MQRGETVGGEAVDFDSALANLRQNMYFCTSKASKLRGTCPCKPAPRYGPAKAQIRTEFTCFTGTNVHMPLQTSPQIRTDTDTDTDTATATATATATDTDTHHVALSAA